MINKIPMLLSPLRIWLFVLLVLVFVFSAVTLSFFHVREVLEERRFQALSNSVSRFEDASSEHADRFKSQAFITKSADRPVLRKYQTLWEENADFAGWIKIDGSGIDYPVMYTGDDFYLTHGFDKKAAKSGTPYIDRRCFVDPFGTNTIIYAHNMKNGTMFSNLLLYRDQEYYWDHPVIRFDTRYAYQEYEILAVLESQAYSKPSNAFKPYDFLKADNESDFMEFIEHVKKLSLYDTEVSAEYGDSLITLITCSYHIENGRFIIVARLKSNLD